MISFNNVSVFVDGIPIITDLSGAFCAGSTVVITGNNGSGKSTLAHALMGLAPYKVSGTITYHGQDITAWPVEKRAQAGIFLAYQQPREIPGLSVATLLYHAYRSIKGTDATLKEIEDKIAAAFDAVGLPRDLMQRGVHEGFSGGQKKRLELVQLLVLEPKLIILDELDSGMDALGVQTMHELLVEYKQKHPQALLFVITHNTQYAQLLNPDTCIAL